MTDREWMVIPDLPTDQQERHLHLARYEYAARVLHGKSVLDCACGMGYGTDLMCRAGVVANGIDIDPAAIKMAKTRYNWHYGVDDIYTTPFGGYHALVSFETLEHLDHPEQIIHRAADAGMQEIISSVPVRPTVHANHWHRTDFTHDSFRELITSGGYQIVHEQGQLWSDGEDMYLMIHGRQQR